MTTPDAAGCDEPEVGGYPSCPPPPANPAEVARRKNLATLAWCAVAALVLAAMIAGNHAATTAQPVTSSSNSPASAADVQYLSALDRMGILYSAPASAITVGRMAAARYDQGWSTAQVVTQFRSSAVDAGGYYTRGQVQAMVTAAIAAYATRPVTN